MLAASSWAIENRKSTPAPCLRGIIRCAIQDSRADNLAFEPEKGPHGDVRGLLLVDLPKQLELRNTSFHKFI